MEIGKLDSEFELLAYDMLRNMFEQGMFEEAMKILCVAIKENKSNLIFILFQYEYDKKLDPLYILIASICSMHPSNKKDNNRIVCKFIEYGMNIFEIYPDDRKLNLLHFTGYGNNTFIIRYVLNIVKEKYPEKIDEYLNGRDSEQNTPLIYAVKNKSEEAARLFLEFGAHVNLYDDQLRTSIWIACSNGNMRIVELLLEYGADFNLCSISGKSPHFMALVNKSYEVAKVISDRGGIKCGPRIPLKRNIDFHKLCGGDEDVMRWIEQSFDSIETYENPDKIWNDIAAVVLDPSNNIRKIIAYTSNYISNYRDSLHSGYSWNMICNKIASIAVYGVKI